MIRVELAYNNGFPWFSKNGCHVRGYIHTPDNQFLSGKSIVDYFLQAKDYAGFIRLVTEADGMFSVILTKEGKAFLASDRIRTFPLYYSVSGQDQILSDSVDRIQKIKGNWKFNQPAITEFLATGFVIGSETLSEDIFQVQAGEAVLLKSDQIQQRLYTTYQTNQADHHSFDDLLKSMEGMSGKVFKRLTASLQGRTAVIPLSGGYDSRLVLLALAKKGATNVVSYLSHSSFAKPE